MSVQNCSIDKTHTSGTLLLPSSPVLSTVKHLQTPPAPPESSNPCPHTGKAWPALPAPRLAREESQYLPGRPPPGP